ncbi:unnamed protein product [Rotaria sp. Silwood1]|nr:unnamed protein product [Rotaria sp. Silwood1]CAF4808625.1 unnamed protein product [Rotaria sp. Silwood1]
MILNDKSDIAGLHHQLGVIAHELEYPKEAMYHYQQVLHLESDMPKTERHRQAPAYASIARLVYCKNDLDQALIYYNKAVELALIEPILDKISIACYYNNIGLVYKRKRRGSSSTYPDVATTYSNIDSIYDKQKRYQEALEYFKKCLNIKLHSLSRNHQSLISSYIAITETLEQFGQFKEAYKIINNSEIKKTYQNYINELRLMLKD